MTVRVGYAAGAFDLFHIGHLNILKHAKSQCDHLIAGVVSDEMLRLTKGVDPVIPLAERLEIVRSIEYVDEAVAETVPDKLDTWRELRQQVANAFRQFDRDGKSPLPWPWNYGDAMAVPPADTPRQNAAVTDTQLLMLSKWAAGDFDADWDPAAQSPAHIDEVPLQAQPATLDRAAMDHCLADAFHPGCEITWPMRHATLYSKPFRIRHRAAGAPEPDYGSTLTPIKVQYVDGPLYAQGPGDITRWMALPWQGDTAFCRSGYDPDFDPYVPTFWAARVPNQVLTEEDYRKAIDPSLQVRVKARDRLEIVKLPPVRPAQPEAAPAAAAAAETKA